ncbi:hypothetical protein GCM10010912_46100 [Paenibacillus albidus]|uniref:Cell wall-binding protein n=1 Tax=Paenibacillus albidus TaxID=2041023 RepID=A0A917FQH0_9BACL|nr:InlB B-repeat-containing protein [Paenibacillus albidus]GGF95972.1 hypothetical protein GCM10010912_46100 [Paenibacillus albidus]
MIRRCISLLTALFILAGMFPSFASADPLDNWSARSPLSTNQNMNGVIYGNGMYVAVGDYGTIVSSSDGVSWTKRTSDTENHLLDVAFGNGMYVAVGIEGTILASSDGVSWTNHTSGTAKLLSVTYGSGKYVAVGEGGTVLTSSDGMSWTSRMSGTTNKINDVTFGNGMYMAAGDNGITLASNDGTSWTTNYTGDLGNLNGITYGNNMYVVVGNRESIMSSSDGVSWTSKSGNSSSIEHLGAVAYGNGKYVAVGYPGLVDTSTDGHNWIGNTSGAWRTLFDVIFGNGIYVAVGDGGTILTSSDGVSWTNRTLGTSSFLVGVTYGNSTYVAVGYRATIVTSKDGLSWTNRTASTFNNLFGVTYGNGRYVAVGGIWGDGTIVTSSDGVNWTNRTSGIEDILNGVTYGDSTYVGVGDNGTILTSGDGASWTNRTMGSASPLYGVTYGDGTYVAVGYRGTIVTSSDGANWTSRTTDTIYDLHGVTYGNGVYVAVGDGGMIVTSRDGVNWTSRTLDTGNNLVGVSYSNGTYVAVGGGNAIFTSSDGVNWTTRTMDTVNPLYAVTYGDSSYVAVGDHGTILQSANKAPTTYTLTYNGNGNTGGTVPTDSSAYEQNASVTVLGNTGSLMKTGHTFTGWNTAANGSGTSYAPNATFNMGASNVTLYAQWTAVPAPKYTVSFDSQGGSAVTSVTGVSLGATISAPAAPTKSGYTFAGWYKEATYGTLWNFGTDTVTENTTLYAKWTAVPASATYTVTFDSQGGSTVTNITYVSLGATISAPAAPTKSGYTFAGWYKEATYATSWNYGTDTVTENTTLYAKWTAIPADTYTVTFDSQGGSTVTDITYVSSGATITAPAEPTKNGYTFAGWYKEANYDTPWNYGTDRVTANLTLYAKWTAVPGSGGDSGGSGGSAPIPSNNSKVISKDGVLSLPAGKNGEVHLGDEIMIGIPANATEQDLILTIKKVLETQSLLQNNEVPVSPIFEILKNSPGNFNKPVTLTLVFEPASLKEGQLPAVFYFDEAMRKWVKVGGIIKGSDDRRG